ncbi:hypothetical protein [Nocardia asteroides]|uniref:hypothetical protein n=1 Tax=Nocardia asteroides TaxID=1824 RepID=UPI003416052C
MFRTQFDLGGSGLAGPVHGVEYPAIGQPGALPDHVVIDKLTGAEQAWLACCVDAVAEGAAAARALFAPRQETAVLARASLARWKCFDQEDDLLVEEADSLDDQGRRESADLSAARALGNLACALTGATDIGTAAACFLAHAERAGLHSAGGMSMPGDTVWNTGPDHLGSLVRSLGEHCDSSARAFAILTLLELAGRRPKTLRTNETNVLLVDVYGAGHRAVLRLTLVDAGPSGLHPDPARMSFLQADAAFDAALVDAWASSELATTAACVLWSVTLDGGAPANDITGGSLGAAFAVCLHYLAPQTRWRRYLRYRLDPSCAIAAELRGEMLVGVGGYPGKLRAAQQNSLRVVVAASGFAEAVRAAPPRFAANISAARTVDEAIRLAECGTDYRVRAVWSAVLTTLVVSGLTIFTRRWPWQSCS